MKVELICTGRTNEFSVFNQCNENPFRNLSKECIFNKDLLGPRNRRKNLIRVCVRRQCALRFIPKTLA